jgi:hypothetical protein
MRSPDPTRQPRAEERRRWTVRRAAAALCAVIATVYVLIGLEVVTVVEETEEVEEAADMLVFGLGAAAIFVLGAALLLAVDRRRFWFAGAALQVMIIAMYVSVGAERTRAFEAWGIALRVMQLVLLAALVYLATRPRDREVTEPVAAEDDRTLAA